MSKQAEQKILEFFENLPAGAVKKIINTGLAILWLAFLGTIVFSLVFK